MPLFGSGGALLFAGPGEGRTLPEGRDRRAGRGSDSEETISSPFQNLRKSRSNGAKSAWRRTRVDRRAK
ncbi:MAG: hypothetical protein MPW14_07190 [Candidatus Manganitrophus sp.]|nr:MAG: hypothetical protein MPW14_07190 [Candidatus Manganitrophus sp.]